MKVGVLFVSVVFAASIPSAARGDSFIEVATGLAIPLAGKPYDRTTDTSGKVGARFGSDLARGVGFDIALDWTPTNFRYVIVYNGFPLTQTRHRVRAQVGLRWTACIGRDLHAFLRASAGVDRTQTANIPGPLGIFTDHDAGLALELGAGVMRDAGGWRFGGQVAVPFADHGTYEETINGVDHYRAFDLDLLLTIAHRL